MQHEQTIDILNWEKFNPRKDLKATSWFRLSNMLAFDEDFEEFDAEEFWLWIFLLSSASRHMSPTIKFNLKYISRHARVPEAKVMSALEKLERIQCVRVTESIRTWTLRARDVDVTCTSHYERTNEQTNEQTNVDVRARDVDVSNLVEKPSAQGEQPKAKDADLKAALVQWQKTLDHFKSGREPLETEKVELFKMLQRIPLQELCHAISGMRFQPKTETYDPAKNLSLFKLWDRERRAKLVTLSTQEAEKRRNKRLPPGMASINNLIPPAFGVSSA